MTERAGISFRHENGLSGKYHYPEIMGAGVCLIDVDGDGYLDIYFVNGNRLVEPPSPEIRNHLYRNNGDGTFSDVTERAGVGDPGFGQGCCVGDYDRDGDPDLYLSNYGPNVLYRNDGDGTFTDVAREAGVRDPAWGQSSAFFDADGDGWLDLYLQNYLTFSLERTTEAFIYIGRQKFPDYPAPSNYPGSADRLYRNNRDGTFTDVSERSGIHESEGKGMGCACFDMDDDGDIDLYVANDGMENYLFWNRGDGTFEEAALVAGVAFDGSGIPESSMGVDVGDFDRDGRLDMVNPCVRKQSYTLYRNAGGRFEDVSFRTGLQQITSSVTGFSPNFIDYDNDGDLDLFFSTGGVRTNELVPPDAPYEERYGLPDILLANDGTGHYADVSAWAGAHFRRRWIGRGTAAGDLDNDGRVDLVVSNLRGRAVVLRNETAGGHWITLKLVPSGAHRSPIGSLVWIEAGGIRQVAAAHCGVTYLSQGDPRVHFGLGAAERVDRLEIQWPDRTREEFRDLAADRFYTIEEGKAPR
ncbi:MAG: CRTAC1 family protein [Planctomycetota bacterium]